MCRNLHCVECMLTYHKIVASYMPRIPSFTGLLLAFKQCMA